MTRPMFTREVSNHMYTPSAYYLASSTSAMVSFCLYPLVTTIVSFYFFGLTDSSFGAMLDWMMILVLTAFAGSYWGFMFGTFMKNDVAAVQLNLLFNILFSFGGGFYANVGEGENIFVKIISYVSPMRYSSEMLMSRVLAGKAGGP